MKNARSLTGKPVGICEDFVSAEERAMLLAHAKSPDAVWETYMPPTDSWYARIMNPHQMPPAVMALMGQIRQRAAIEIKRQYGITDPVFADTLQLVRWMPGHDQHPHADAEEADGSIHLYPWRAFASIIYLNNDFEGGQIYFPRLGLEPPITPGMMAFFPGTLDYLHGVRPITAGIRYTIASFYSFDASQHDGYPI
jgi:hypothetical protein